MDQDDAARMLRQMQATRSRMAGRARWSVARHAAVGLVMGVLIASYALPQPWMILVALGCIGATAAIIARDRSRDGFFVNGYRGGRTRPLAIGLCILSLTMLGAAMILRQRFDLWWAPLLLGGLAFVVVTVGSILWEHVYRRELGADVDDA